MFDFLLHADDAGSTAVESCQRLERVIALLALERRHAVLEGDPVQPAPAVVRLELGADARADLVQAGLSRCVLRAATDVLAIFSCSHRAVANRSTTTMS